MPKDRTYYKDKTDNDVKGILVISSTDTHVRVTENRDGSWATKWQMPLEEFETMTCPNTVTEVGRLSDEQFDAVMHKSQPLSA